MSSPESEARSAHHQALAEYYYEDCCNGGGEETERMFSELLGREVKGSEIDVGGPDRYVPSKKKIADLFEEVQQKTGHDIGTFFYIGNRLISLEDNYVLDELIREAAEMNKGNEAVSEELEEIIVSWLTDNAETLRAPIAAVLEKLHTVLPEDAISLIMFVDVNDKGEISLRCRDQKTEKSIEFKIGRMPLPTDDVSGQTAVAVKGTLEQ